MEPATTFNIFRHNKQSEITYIVPRILNELEN